MSRLTVTCRSCAAPVGEYEIQDHGLIPMVLAQTHAGGPHGGVHALEVLIDGQPITRITTAPGPPSAAPLAVYDDGTKTVQPAPSSQQGVLQAVAVVEIECQQSACQNQDGNSRRKWEVPRWFAGAVPIQHHASHEGHPFKLWLDGVEVRPV